jgi:hypothetical protein
MTLAALPSPRVPRQAFVCTVALLVVVLLAACSGGSRPAQNGGAKETDTTPQAASVPVTAVATEAQTSTPTASPTPSPSPSPSPTPEPSPTEAPTPVQTLADGSHGYVTTSSAVVQAGPSTQSAVVARLRYEQQLTLLGKVRGERIVVGDQAWPMAIQDWSNTWYKVDGGYVYAAYVWVPRPGELLPEQLGPGERWVSVDLAIQKATLMVGSTAVYTAPVTTGKPGFETPTGHWRVGYQVLNETMTSAQAGINNPAEQYDVHNVLYTQYFDNAGDALHLNYWQPESVFGSERTSHGCVGLYIQDAQYFWLFGQVGMRVEITSAGRILPPPAPPSPVRTATQAPVPARTVVAPQTASTATPEALAATATVLPTAPPQGPATPSGSAESAPLASTPARPAPSAATPGRPLGSGLGAQAQPPPTVTATPSGR